MDGLLNFNGIPVVSSLNAVNREFTRKPRSKKRRIVKKWKRHDRNYTFQPAAFFMSWKYVMHPEIIRRLKDHQGGRQ